MSNSNLKIISAVTFILIFLLMSLLFSCNPVKRVLLNDEYYKIVTDKFVSEGGCVNDSIFKSDTTVLFDTLYSLDFKLDTFYIDQIKTVVKTEYKTVSKTIKIRDTAVVTDYTRIKLLTEKIAAKDAEIIAAKQAIKEQELKVKEQKQRANGWIFKFWLLIVAVSIYVFRKPLFKLIKGVISPIKI
jgi:hypothetical protein